MYWWCWITLSVCKTFCRFSKFSSKKKKEKDSKKEKVEKDISGSVEPTADTTPVTEPVKQS